MAKRPERMKKSTRPSYSMDDFSSSPQSDPRFVTRQKKAEPLQAQTQAQGHYLCALESSQLIFAIGPAGTGKTYVASAYAADLLKSKAIEKISHHPPQCRSRCWIRIPAGRVGGKIRTLLGSLQGNHD